MKTTLLTLCGIFLLSEAGISQEPPQPSPAPVIALNEMTPFEIPGDQNDPGYKIYKTGYQCILDEQWDNARQKFADLMSRYPKSKYRDDAGYWSAFALKHLNRKKAVATYEKFIEEFPESKYYDDAVADLHELHDNMFVVTSRDSGEVTVQKGKGWYAFGTGTNMQNADRQLRLSERLMQHQLMHVQRIRIPHAMGAPYVFAPNNEKLDKETRLKMDALYAIGDTKEDSTSFKTLRDVALDRTQPSEVRSAAMDALSEFKKFDVLPVFIEIAKTDTSEESQSAAIDYIGQLNKNKNRAVESLVELFNSIPKHRTEQLQTVLNSIAEIGNDNAVSFLAAVAKTNENYDLRSDAVYYLGSIGGDKARAALYEILKEKRNSKQ